MLFENLLTIMSGTLTDAVVGDPPSLPHPVVGFGKLIAILERGLNRAGLKPINLRLRGLMVVILVVGLAYGLTSWLLGVLTPWPWLFWPVNIGLMGTTIAAKGLHQAGAQIKIPLQRNDLAAARLEVAKIVGRDTTDLTEAEVVRATVESIAENSVDGVIAPLCFGLIGGTPLAMAYRAVNTLDSMLGYKNERFLDFGRAAARLDDLANLIPARLTAIIMIISAFCLRLDWKNGFKIAWRDASKHPSPNGGWPEATVAGALGVRLGGQNVYGSAVHFRAYLGDARRPLAIEDIDRTRRMLTVSVEIVMVVAIIFWAMSHIIIK